MPRRVVVSGIGAITPIGVEREGLWQGLRAQRSAVGTVTRFDPSIFRSRNAAEVRDFVATDHLEQRRAKRLDRFGHFSVVAAKMAIADSQLDLQREDRELIGTMMGSALGGVAYAEDQMGRFLREGLRAVDATLALAVFGGASSCNIAIEFGVSGQFDERKSGESARCDGERIVRSATVSRCDDRRCAEARCRCLLRSVRVDSGDVDAQRRSGNGLAAVRSRSRRIVMGRGHPCYMEENHRALLVGSDLRRAHGFWDDQRRAPMRRRSERETSRARDETGPA